MLTPQQLSDFHYQGFLVVEDLLDRKTVLQPLIKEYDAKLKQLCRNWIATGKLPRHTLNQSFEDGIKSVYAAGLDYFQPLDISLPPEQITAETPIHCGDAVFGLLTSSALLDCIESILGPEITSNPIQHVRIKPPSTQLYDDEIRAHITVTDWHQDRAVTLEEADETRMVTAWVAITDATTNNGCLQVIPGSHRGEMQPHCPQSQLSIPKDQFNVEDAMPLPVKAGGAIFFHPLTIHSSLSNTTDAIRWSFDLRYNVTGDATGRPMFPSFVARSRSNPHSVLKKPESWRQLWQLTQQRLTHEPAVEIHRWPADAPYCA